MFDDTGMRLIVSVLTVDVVKWVEEPVMSLVGIPVGLSFPDVKD